MFCSLKFEDFVFEKTLLKLSKVSKSFLSEYYLKNEHKRDVCYIHDSCRSVRIFENWFSVFKCSLLPPSRPNSAPTNYRNFLRLVRKKNEIITMMLNRESQIATVLDSLFFNCFYDSDLNHSLPSVPFDCLIYKFSTFIACLTWFSPPACASYFCLRMRNQYTHVTPLISPGRSTAQWVRAFNVMKILLVKRNLGSKFDDYSSQVDVNSFKLVQSLFCQIVLSCLAIRPPAIPSPKQLIVAFFGIEFCYVFKYLQDSSTLQDSRP